MKMYLYKNLPITEFCKCNASATVSNVPSTSSPGKGLPVLVLRLDILNFSKILVFFNAAVFAVTYKTKLVN